MKRLIPFLVISLFFSLPSFGQNFISDSLLEVYSKTQIDSIDNANGASEATAFTLYSVKLYRVIYYTLNATGTDTTIASGLLVLPDSVDCPLPLLVYDHGTVLNKLGVPSFLSQEAVIGILFAAYGYASVLPDYLGLGVSPGFHPYIHAKSEATATIDMLRAVRQLAVADSIELSSQLFLTGYSQGGHSCMATHREIEQNYSNEFTVTASAPNSGPYDVSGVQAETIVDSLTYADPSYLPYIVLAYQSVYGNLYNLNDSLRSTTDLFDSLQQVFIYPYDSIVPIYYNGNYTTGYVDGKLTHQIDDMVQASELDTFLADSANDPLRIDLADNDVYQWVPKAPMNITYCDSDEEVFPGNAMVAYNYFMAHGDSGIVTIQDGGPYSHTGCVTPALLNTILFFNAHRVLENNLTLILASDSSSSLDSNNAQVSVSVSGGTGYSIAWTLNGSDSVISTDSTVTGLPDTTVYTVTVTDARGCTKVRNDTTGITSVTGITAPAAKTNSIQFSAYPNPANDELNYTIVSAQQHTYTLELYNMSGQKMLSQAAQPGSGSMYGYMDVSQFPAGIYCLKLFSGNSSVTKIVTIAR